MSAHNAHMQASDEATSHSACDMAEDGPATAAMGAEVLLGRAGDHGQSHRPMLTRRMALSEFAFLMEPPQGVIMHMLDQVMMSKLPYQLIDIQYRMS